MDFNLISPNFVITVGDSNRVAGYLEECLTTEYHGAPLSRMWLLYSYDGKKLAKFHTLREATKNLHPLEEHLKNDEEWLNP